VRVADGGSLEHVAATWQQLGKDDPLWAVLTRPDRRRSWDLQEFLATGRAKVADTLAAVTATTGWDGPYGDALDFGCGVGRLTRALSERFATVTGVDIAESMLERAREINADRPNCRFVHNQRADLSTFEDESFDFVLSAITLQHIPPDAALGYIGEFVRVLRPVGIAVFETALASRRQRVKQLLPRSLVVAFRHARDRDHLRMEMFPLRSAEAAEAVAASGGRIVHRDYLDHGWRYFVRR